jgi:quinohemoprotein ethanol dehydrogenase
MRGKFESRLALACAAMWMIAMAGCGPKQTVVDDAALRAADGDTANWITYGRTYSEQRFSPLKQINEQSVGKLGMAWYYNLETLRGVEATPLVKDGVMYTTSSWSIVYAFDAKTGKIEAR